MASVVVVMLMIMVMMRLLASVAVTMMRFFVFMAMAMMPFLVAMAVMCFFFLVAVAMMCFLVLVTMAMMRFLVLVAVAMMRFFVLVAMAVMRFFVFMAMAVMRFFVLVAMAVMRFFLRSCRADRCRAIEVRHIMVMIFMGFIQNDIEITARNAGFLDAGNFHHEAVRRDGIQCAFQRFRICAEVDHRCDEHISADAGGSFKVQCFSHFDFSLLVGIKNGF